MIADFNGDSLRQLLRQQKLSNEELASFQETLSPLDMTLVMKQFELEMKNPIKNALIGDFIRMVLIQIQKQKSMIEALVS
jgi:nuclear-control-of-ATPase protein 2